MPGPRDINWNRLIAEGLAIVISILLAFGIDAWWDERKERIEEQEILQGLNEEFQLIREVLANHKQWAQRRLEASERLLAELKKDSPQMTAEQLSAVIEDLFSPTTSDISNGVLRALLSSGRLEIISSRRLREKLVGWELAIEEVWDDQQDNAKRVYEIHVPFLVEGGYGFGEVRNYWYPENTAPIRLISDNPADLKRLLGDPKFRTIVEINYVYKIHLLEEFDSAIAAATDILAEIEASIHPVQ